MCPAAHAFVRFARFLVSVLLLSCLTLTTRAAGPDVPAARAAVVGQPQGLTVQPETLSLVGPRARQQILVTGRYADNKVRDLTVFADVTCEDPAVAEVAADGYLLPTATGTPNLAVQPAHPTANASPPPKPIT